MKSTFSPATDTTPPSELFPPTAETPKDDPGVSVPRDPPSGTVVEASFFRNENMSGEYDKNDLIIPGLNLVHAVGDLSAVFSPGQLVYNKEDVVPTPVTVTVLRTKKYLQEKLPYGSEILPRRFTTQAEARAAGLVPQWEKKNAGNEELGVFEPVLETQLLIEGDPAKHSAWPLEFKGKPYAIARYIFKSYAYDTAKVIISAAALGLSRGLHTGYWQMTTVREKKGINWVWLPKMRLTGKHDEETLAWLSDKL